MKHLCTIALLAFCVGAPISTRANDLWVPSEFDTIQAAVDAATDGDRVIVAPFQFTETVTVTGKAISIETESNSQGYRAEIRGAPGADVAISISSHAQLELKHLIVTKRVDIIGAESAFLNGCTVSKGSPAIHCQETHELRLKDCLVTSVDGGTGLMAERVGSVQIDTSRLEGAAADDRSGCFTMYCPSPCPPGDAGGDGCLLIECPSVLLGNSEFIGGHGGERYCAITFTSFIECMPCTHGTTGPEGVGVVASESGVFMCNIGGTVQMERDSISFPMNCAATAVVCGVEGYEPLEADTNVDSVVDAADLIAFRTSRRTS